MSKINSRASLMQAGAAHAKTEWKRKMTAGVKCKKRLCISDFCICVEVQAIFYKKGMIGQKYGKHVTLKNRTSDRIATNPYLNKLYLTVFSELSNSGENGKKWKLKRYWQRIFGG